MEICKRNLHIIDWETEVDLNKPLARYPGNPIVSCADVNRVWKDPKYQVITVHNAGITTHNDEVIMLFRSHLRNGVSVIGTARSRNGINNWEIDSEPSIKPCNDKDVFAEGTSRENLIENEAGGVEDPRISCIGDTYFITIRFRRKKNRNIRHLNFFRIF